MVSEGERGSAALETIGAIGLLFVAVTLLLQFVCWQYARGVVQAAVRESVRDAAKLEVPSGTCERRFESVVSGLLPGPLGDGVSSPVCTITTTDVAVTATVHLERWLPISPDWRFEVTAVAVRERVPGAR